MPIPSYAALLCSLLCVAGCLPTDGDEPTGGPSASGVPVDDGAPRPVPAVESPDGPVGPSDGPSVPPAPAGAAASRPAVAVEVEAPAEPPRLSRFGEAPPLRDLAAVHGLRLGFAAPHDMFLLDDSALYTAIASEEYDILTPEDSMKMTYLRHVPGRYEWERSDRLVEFAEAHGMVVHGHPLIWSGQVTQWIRDLDRSELPELMREHIATLVSRYRGRVDVWDVVNEGFFPDGRPRDSLWYQSMGEAYIAEAFRVARDHDPDATLVYNDFDIGWLSAKSDALHAWLVDELERGTPIDDVGFQMHLETGDFPGADSLRENFRRFAELGLDIYITEMDVAVDWRADPATEELEQADIYFARCSACCRRCRRHRVPRGERTARPDPPPRPGRDGERRTETGGDGRCGTDARAGEDRSPRCGSWRAPSPWPRRSGSGCSGIRRGRCCCWCPPSRRATRSAARTPGACGCARARRAPSPPRRSRPAPCSSPWPPRSTCSGSESARCSATRCRPTR